MEYLDKIRETLCAELDDVSRKADMNMRDLDLVHKLTDTIKNIYKIEMYSGEGAARGYSRGGEYDANIRGNYGREHSYRHYVRGHYSREDSSGHMKHQLREMMEETDDERVKEALRRCMESVDK